MQIRDFPGTKNGAHKFWPIYRGIEQITETEFHWVPRSRKGKWENRRMDAPNNSARFMCWQHEMGGWSAIYMYRNLGLLKPFHLSKNCEMVNKPLLFKRKLFTEMGKMTRSNFLHFSHNRTEWNVRRRSPSFSSMQEQGHFPRPIEDLPGNRHGNLRDMDQTHLSV